MISFLPIGSPYLKRIWARQSPEFHKRYKRAKTETCRRYKGVQDHGTLAAYAKTFIEEDSELMSDIQIRPDPDLGSAERAFAGDMIDPTRVM